MTGEEYQKRMEFVKKAVKDDLTAADSRKSILKARLWCRDDEDRFNLCCYYDFSPYMDMLFRRFDPDVKEWIHEKYMEVKEWHLPSEKPYKIECSEMWRKYHQELYSEEQISKKYYVTVTKYTEIDRNMTILYNADFSLKGELVSIDDPTGSYRGFARYEEKEYILSEPEKIISDNLYLFGPYPDVELPYDKGDILYIDGCPHERRFYAVWCGDRFLYIKNGERLADFIKYKIPDRYYKSHNLDRVSLEYHKPVPLYYHVTRVETCGYDCLMKASRLLKNSESAHNDDIRENVGEIFRREFQDATIPAEYKSGSRMNEICQLLSGEICENYQKATFTDFFARFKKWLEETKRICLDKLDDEQLLYLLSYYCSDHLNYHEYRSREFEKWCQDRDNLFWCE